MLAPLHPRLEPSGETVAADANERKAAHGDENRHRDDDLRHKRQRQQRQTQKEDRNAQQHGFDRIADLKYTEQFARVRKIYGDMIGFIAHIRTLPRAPSANFCRKTTCRYMS